MYLLATGTEVDLHTAHTHGSVGISNGIRKDVIQLVPDDSLVYDFVADSPGTWMFHCHVDDHFSAGMSALYHVKGDALVLDPPTAVRTYYIASQGVEWDYAPGISLSPSSPAPMRTYLDGSPANRIGSIYTKTRYLEYTDATFTT